MVSVATVNEMKREALEKHANTQPVPSPLLDGHLKDVANRNMAARKYVPSMPLGRATGLTTLSDAQRGQGDVASCSHGSSTGRTTLAKSAINSRQHDGAWGQNTANVHKHERPSFLPSNMSTKRRHHHPFAGPSSFQPEVALTELPHSPEVQVGQEEHSKPNELTSQGTASIVAAEPETEMQPNMPSWIAFACIALGSWTIGSFGWSWNWIVMLIIMAFLYVSNEKSKLQAALQSSEQLESIMKYLKVNKGMSRLKSRSFIESYFSTGSYHSWRNRRVD
jgi:hypothetical protein